MSFKLMSPGCRPPGTNPTFCCASRELHSLTSKIYNFEAYPLLAPNRGVILGRNYLRNGGADEGRQRRE